MTENDNMPRELDLNDPTIEQTLRKAIAPTVTDSEWWICLNYIKSTGLNPLKNEIWVTKSEGYRNKRGEWVEGKMQLMTGINGFLAIANKHPMFDGMETSSQLAGGDKPPISATCKVYRRDRAHPHVCTVYFSEYYKAGFNGRPSVWDQKPITMIEKVAKARALREAFPQELNNLYTDDEMPTEFARVTQVAEPTPEIVKEPAKPTIKLDQMSELAETKYFSFPERNAAQETFLIKRGCYRDDVTGQWICPKGTTIETKALVKLSQFEVPDLHDADELPEWTEETKPLPVELPKWKDNESLEALNKRILDLAEKKKMP